MGPLHVPPVREDDGDEAADEDDEDDDHDPCGARTYAGFFPAFNES